MKITRSVAPFEFLRRVFSGKLSTACGLPLTLIQDGDKVFGNLKGLTPTFHSQVGALAKYRERCEVFETPFPDHWEGIRKILVDCMWESSLSQYPAATLCNRIEIRKNWVLVAPVDAYRLSKITTTSHLIYSFFKKLCKIMNGKIVFAEVMLNRAPISGVVVGKVTDPLIKQIILLFNEVDMSHGSCVNQSSDSLLKQFSDRPVFEFMVHKFLKERMGDQLDIITAIFVHALRFQGFDHERSQQMSQYESDQFITVNNNWDILIPVS